MLMPEHEIVSIRERAITRRRAVTIGGVGLLHVAAVYALISGMAAQIVKLVPPDLQIETLQTTTRPNSVPVPQLPTLARPTQDTTPKVEPPIINVANTDGATITVTSTTHAQPAADSGATGVSGTHSTPPYPLEARAQSHQGTALLQLTISPRGDVVAANIAQSSGYAELDAAAVSWVMAHWKYKPAIQGGVAVTSQTQAAVKFDLKQVRA